MRFRYGIEHECALLHTDGRFADFTEHHVRRAAGRGRRACPRTRPTTRTCASATRGSSASAGTSRATSGSTTAGELVRCDPKGLEIRTRIHDSVDAAVDALRADLGRLDAALAQHGLRTTTIAFNPLRSEYVIEPPLNDWERAHRLGSPEERTAHLHMSTYGPDLNLSCADLGPADLVDVGRKLTHYSPWLVPLSFSSPFRDGSRGAGCRRAPRVRTGVRPAALVFLGGGGGAGARRPVADAGGAAARGGRARSSSRRSTPAPTRRSTASCSACSPVWCWTARCPGAAPPRTPRCTGTWPRPGWPTTRCTRAPATCSTPRRPLSPAAPTTWPGWSACAPAGRAASPRPRRCSRRYEAGEPVAGLSPDAGRAVLDMQPDGCR